MFKKLFKSSTPAYKLTYGEVERITTLSNRLDKHAELRRDAYYLKLRDSNKDRVVAIAKGLLSGSIVAGMLLAGAVIVEKTLGK